MPNPIVPRRRLWLMAGALLVAALLMWWFSARHGDGEEPRAPKPGAERTSEVGPTSASVAKLSTVRRRQPPPRMNATPSVPLPPLNTKIVDVLAQLKDAADHGDSRAACRVGVELSRCFRAHQFVAMADSEAEAAAAQKDPVRALDKQQSADALRQDVEPDLALCQGVSPDDYNEAWSYLVQSASEGNAEAAASFYISPPLSLDGNHVSDVMTAWLEHREEYRDLAISAGDVYALNAAAVMESMGIGAPGAFVKYTPSPYNALKFATALAPLDKRQPQNGGNNHEDYVDYLHSKLSPQEIADAEREGVLLREKYFSDVKPVDDVQQAGIPRPERCAK